MPQSILCNRYALAELAWSDIEALMLRNREPQRRNYVPRNGILDIEGLPATTFRRQFRFEQADFGVLMKALEMPDIVTSAQGVRVAGTEAMCMCLRRLAYPNRLCDLQRYFGRHYSVTSSITNKVMLHLETQFGALLDNLTAHPWLTPAHLKEMSDVSLAYILFISHLSITSRQLFSRPL